MAESKTRTAWLSTKWLDITQWLGDKKKKLNHAVAVSFVGSYFRLAGSGHPRTRKHSTFTTEIRAGLATFFAMAYIVSVNATILTDSGGTCQCGSVTDKTCSSDPEYNICLTELHRDFITGTAAVAALTSFAMGLFANMPIALAPGMGLNAYFTYTVVGFHGTGPVPYRLALTAVFVEGFIFVGLSLLGLRQWLARMIPVSIKLASSVGIGLYLEALVGLTYSAGIGVITGATSTPIELAGCSVAEEAADLNGICLPSQKMRSPTMWIAIFCGGFLTAMLLVYRVKGAIVIGITLVSVISWPRGTSVTYFPDTAVGNAMFDFFKKVVTFHPITKVFGVQDWDVSANPGQFPLAFITFLYVDILDCTGTMYAMARYAGAIDPVTQDFEGSAMAYLIDALSISAGSVFGLSPVTAFIESGAGISEGGKTGLTAITTGFCFFICVFFAPIFASFPPWATGCTLILVGAMMAKAVLYINWRYYGDSLPAFLTLAVMPFTYSIAYGLIIGIISYAIMNGLIWVVEKATGHSPPDIGKKERFSWQIKGGILPPWVQRLLNCKQKFWRKSPSPNNADDADAEEPKVTLETVAEEEESNVTAISGQHGDGTVA